MVEDELLHTARLFTAHLHRAEYARLKQVAKAHNAAAIREIERPVVAGPPTARARRRREAALRTAKQRRVGVDEAQGSSLLGLMETPRREVASLGTRAVRADVEVAERGSGSPDGTPVVEQEGEDEGEDEDEDDDDPFGVRKRMVRREKSREQMRGTGDLDAVNKRRPDTIPSFF
jgi:hypothetical protein